MGSNASSTWGDDGDEHRDASATVLSLSHSQPGSELIKSYYTAYKGLSNGSGSRRALPPELVLYICRLAEFEWGYTKRAPKGRQRVHASGPEAQSHIWFQIGPFTKQMLNRTKGIQLVTISRHQGWVTDRKSGSWSWFELQVARATRPDGSRVKVKRRHGDEVSWRCLEHPIDAKTSKLQKDFAEHRGAEFGLDHDIWDQIKEGDVLRVVMKAQFGGWINEATGGMLKISTWWEPSSEMVALMESSNTQFA